jgi:hypothetical protein
MTRTTNFSPAAEAAVAGAVLVAGAAGEMLGPVTEPDEAAGELVAADGNPLAALGAALLLGFAARPEACLHRSDSEFLCSLRQATIRPPPGCTPAHSFLRIICARGANRSQ